MNFTVSTVRRLLALALVGAAAVTAVVLLGGGDATSAADPEPSGPTVNPITPPGTPAELAAQFASGFALLRAPGGSSIPATVGVDDPSLDVADARQLTPPSAGTLARTAGDATPGVPDATVWVAPREDGSQCLLAYLHEEESLGGACIWPQDALAGRFVMTQSVTGQDASLYGLMPDGVDSVTVELADGSTAELPVVDNTYMAQFDQPTASITWIDGDGVEQTEPIASGG